MKVSDSNIFCCNFYNGSFRSKFEFLIWKIVKEITDQPENFYLIFFGAQWRENNFQRAHFEQIFENC